MLLVRHPNCCPQPHKGAVVALGNFDGVHQGHKLILQTTISLAKQAGISAAAMCFEPHPRQFFKPNDAPFRLTSLRQKHAIFKQQGIDLMLVPHFNQAFCQLTGEQFIHQILHQQLAVSHVVIGYDFMFGKGRSGNSNLLRDLGQQLGFSVSEINAQPTSSGEPCSSTAIRQHLRQGEIAQANDILGHPWQLEGRVIRGKQLGRTIGFATANIALKQQLRPKFGVYSATAIIKNKRHPAIVNIGNRPTVDGTQELLEVHILDGDHQIYGQHIKIELNKFIRPEQKFDGIDALKTQISKDIAICRKIIS